MFRLKYKKRFRSLFLLLLLIPVSVAWSAEAPGDKSQLQKSALRFTRVDHTFLSQGLKCGAWLYLPEGVAKPPVIVMAHGFGGQRWWRLPAYAERFARRGMAVFIFDYRGFNDSEGQPRNYVNPKRHLQDWKAAIAYVRTLNAVDAKRIALWGTSFSGGHVIPIAAEDQNIKAIVAQVPFTDGITTELSYLSRPMFALKAMYHGFADVFDSIFTNHRHNVLIVGKPGGAFGMMSTADAMPGVLKLIGIPENELSPQNYCPANIVFTLGLYRPISYAKKVACPALIIGAEKDSLFPPDGPKKMADRMQKATYISLPMGHFDPYVGEPFEKIVTKMGDFLQANLK
jgi:dienelactone hydrolase